MLVAVMSSKRDKTELLTVRMAFNTYVEFAAVAALRGATLSGLVHQFAVKTIREERERDPAEFARQVLAVETELRRKKARVSTQRAESEPVFISPYLHKQDGILTPEQIQRDIEQGRKERPE